jgi:integrase
MLKGEILNLKWADVDFERGFIRVVKSKNSESRDIPMSAYLSGVFRQLKNRGDLGDYVFCNADGSKRKGFHSVFEKARCKAGLEDFRFHDLRHTAASLFAAGGCDIITLQHLLGHKSITMTQRYAHLMPEKHLKTRQIIEDFWGDFSATIKTTPSFSHPAENRPNRPTSQDTRPQSPQA